MTRLHRWLRALFTRTRYCEDCRYCTIPLFVDHPSTCTHDESGEDDGTYLVQRGTPRRVKPYACSLMRRGACGRDGKLWRVR